jgi:hypothetical protein
MAADPSIRYSLMRTIGAGSVCLAIIDQSPDPCPTCAKTRAALVDGFNGRPLVKPQTCPRGIHRDWWADGDDLACPWCRIDDLEAARVELSEAS